MTKTQLNKLVGLTVAKAKKLVKEAGFVTRVYDENQMLPSITLPKNVVRMFKNENGLIVQAETQAAIDAKYAKKH